MASSTIVESLEILKSDKQKFVPQDTSEATYAKKIEKSESKIIWNSNADQVVAKINALYPNPGSWFELNGSRIKVLKAKVVNKSGNPGEIIDESFTIACLKNSIQILELKKEGKRSMKASDFIKGNKLKVGNIINGT